MEKKDMLLILIAVILNIISYIMMIRDISENKEMYAKKGEKKDNAAENADIKENEERQIIVSKQCNIYAVIMMAVSVGIAVFLQKFYVDNAFLFNVKRVCLLSVLWPVAYIDYKSYRIPNTYIILGIVYRVTIIPFELWTDGSRIIYVILSEMIAGAALFIAAFLCKLFVKNSIGSGDIKLFIVMSLFLGLNGIWNSIILTMLITFFVCIVLLATKKKSRKDKIPFGPSIVAGTFLSVFLTGM